jgi:DGQHR domain-containing protein
MPSRRKTTLEKAALRIDQNPSLPLYVLSLTGTELTAVAAISRISRTSGGLLSGYQRGEVRAHIHEIIDYLNGDDTLLPNSIILAFDPSVVFQRAEAPDLGGGVSVGIVSIPLPTGDTAKPGWIVDGQQRAAALMESKRTDWPVPVNAFIASDPAIQRDQFLRVNNTRPLPKRLIIELLPEVDTSLPRRLASKRVPSLLCERLNGDKASPFRGLIRRETTPVEARRSAPIADLSVVRMLEESLTKPSGCLFPFYNMTTGELEGKEAWRVLIAYWSAVRDTFPDAWGCPASRSRLMHGTGIRAMGRLMDRMMAGFHPREANLSSRLRDELQAVAPVCKWTDGRWEEIGLEWKDVQNVPRHLRMVSDFLIRTYLRGRGGAG